jgi:hypothetical protein
MRGLIALCAAVLLLAGCAATGVKVSEQQAEAFKVGTSTYSDVVASLGPPTSTTVTSNGTRTAAYTYAAVRAQAQNFIPYIGGLVAGYDTQSSIVTFNFDGRGVLTGTTSTESGAGVGTNLAAGTNAATQPYQQPR